MDRRRRRPPDDPSRQADYAAREAANLLTYYGRRYPVATVVVIAVALVVGLMLYWQQQRRLSEQQQQEQSQRSQLPPPPPATSRIEAPTAEPPPTDEATTAASSSGESVGQVNLLLGNPSGATPDPSDRNNYLMVKRHYALSYNASRGTPNWVSWRVTSNDLGTAPRKRQFDPDADLPAPFYRVTHRDYSGGGFDRGHLCPHSDRAATQQSSFATFVMSNIVPQAPSLNQGAWAQLEDYTRDQVSTGRNRAYVVAGPSGTGGTGTAGFTEAIALGRVTVSSECWKIVVVVPVTPGPSSAPGDELASVTAAARVIAVVMPNNEMKIGSNWTVYRTSASDVEQRTGYRFFDRLPPEVAEALRRRVDQTPVAPARVRER